MTLGVVLPACGGDGNPAGPSGNVGGGTPLTVIPGTVVGQTVTVAIAGTALATVGSSALVQAGLGEFLVTHDTQDSFTALTATCTHEQCTVATRSGNAFVCPCHGSRFSTGGAVLGGPATQALATFTTQFDGTTLTISQ